jgi:hypothetical protein
MLHFILVFVYILTVEALQGVFCRRSPRSLVFSYYSLHTCPHVCTQFALKFQHLAPAIVDAVKDTQVVDRNVLSRDNFDSFLSYLTTS